MSLLPEVIVCLWFIPLAIQVFVLVLFAAGTVKKGLSMLFSAKKRSTPSFSASPMGSMPKTA